MSVVSLTKAKDYLNLKASTSDEELALFLNRAEAALAQRIGPLSEVAKTERVRGRCSALRLSFAPVISLTSVTSIEGGAIPTTQLTPTPGGRIEFLQYGYFPSRFYDVAYQAGRATLDGDLEGAVLELVRLLWSTTQRGTNGRAAPGAELSIDGLLSAWADQLARPHRPVLLA